MKYIIGKKLGMTQVFRDDGTVVPVTRVEAGPCVVVQVKTKEKNGVNAIQIGFGEQKIFRLNKALQGHLKGLGGMQYLRDVRTAENDPEFKRGDIFTVRIFIPGEKVQVVGHSKGKGFQGVVKRHGFRGGPATHGHKDNLRMPGSIGAGGVQRVFKDMRMGGHMGDQQVTVKNLEIVAVEEEKNELLIKGAMPGARGSLLLISTQEGTIEIEKKDAAAATQPQEPQREAEKPETAPTIEIPVESPQQEDAATQQTTVT